MKKFPKVLHVTIEEGRNEPDFLTVAGGGIFDVIEDGKPIAVYKLVSAGRVKIEKSFVQNKRR